MSYEDYDDRPELPSAAGDPDAEKFEPNDDWLRNAPKELQIEAMRQWFYARYQDPANDTPYNGREGGYLFIHGGPYDPDEEIQERFSDVVEFDVMEELISDLASEHGDQWAPVDHDQDYSEWEYEEALSQIEDDGSPISVLTQKLGRVEEILTAPAPDHIKQMITQLVHGAAIAALEAYLLEVTVWRALNNDGSLRSFVENNTDPKLGGATFKLSEIHQKMDGLKKQVFAYLQTYVWHRLDDVKTVFENSFKIKFPNVLELRGDILVRHDIVHRGGKNKAGDLVAVTPEDVREVTERIKIFAKALEAEFEEKNERALQ
ncbi:hypothetical protein [Pseudomonas poae]|uniref:hypothetical protein n=1 Tax=Pseudomonas poae TaxID=200451 RepID=UPI0030D4F03B